MLLGQTPDEKTIANVRADGAYDTRKSHEVIVERNARAFILPLKKRKTIEPL